MTGNDHEAPCNTCVLQWSKSVAERLDDSSRAVGLYSTLEARRTWILLSMKECSNQRGYNGKDELTKRVNESVSRITESQTV